jgi:hypothetical protein
MKPIRLFLAAICLLAAACLRDPKSVAGGWTDTDTGTKISGIILREDGLPAAGALVLLRPADYLAKNPAGADSLGTSPSGGSVLDAQCDSTGRFRLDSVRAGRYSLEARDREIKGALIRFQAAEDEARLDLSPAVTRALGSITGRVAFSDSVPGPVLVRILGLEQAVLSDPATGRFRFTHVPQGRYTLRFSGLEPFVSAREKTGIPVAPDSLTDAGDILLLRGLKQDFRETAGVLDLAGVDSTNPVIYENGAFINPVDGAYLWAKASKGSLDLRGVLVSYGGDTGAASLEWNRNNCLGLMRIARLSGMRGIPEPVLGAKAKLVRPASGNFADIRPEANDGTALLIAEARKATPEKPLIVIGGANLTTIASALLIDPAIADRMLVFGTNNGNFNKDDSLALEVVSKKARLVAWARDFTWADAKLPAETDSPRLGNRYAELMRAHREKDRTPVLWALSFFADFGASTYLFRREVWRSAVPADWIAPPMAAAAPAASGNPFDFVDVPLAATDWTAMQKEFYAAINDPAAYHPWPLSGGLMAEAYSAASGTTVLPGLDGSGEALNWNGPGSLAEYSVTAGAAGTYAFDLRFRCGSASSLSLGSPAGNVRAEFPASNVWDTVTIEIPMASGSQVLRIECLQGAPTLDWLHPHAP